jgi:hypothetical protein
MKDLTLAAGPTAFAHIQKNGLQANDVAAIFGASGAAKWLAIAGLDQAVFEGFMATRSAATPVELFGTSVGAFKLAAAARTAPGKALAALAQSYIYQSYAQDAGLAAVDRETKKLLRAVCDEDLIGAGEILANPKYHLHIGTVRCHGWLNHPSKAGQALALARAGLAATVSDNHLQGMAERVIFSDPRSSLELTARDSYKVRQERLTSDVFLKALRASGSIPVYMQPVLFDDDAAHAYRDGGLLDYHPIPSSFWPRQDGLILYPHFYDHFKTRWFDKFYPWRRASADRLDRVVMVSPSRDYIAKLPDAKIPARQDFMKYRKNETDRFDKWQIVVQRSHDLGAQFLEACQSGDIARHVVPL